MPARFYKTVLLAALAAIPISQAQAHTTSIGYESAGQGALNFWYGTYHGSNFTEGSFSLVGQDVTYSATVPFSLLTTLKPVGLVDGVTNFYSGGVATTLVAADPLGSPPTSWQGVSFANLTPGTYVFTYIPIAMPTQDWAPINAAILSSSVTLTADLLGELTPSTIDGSKPEFTEADAAVAAGQPLVFDGGVLKPSTTLAFDQPVTLNGAGGTVNTANGDLTFSGGVGGAGQLVKDGGGTLYLTGANTYAGGTVINAGTVSGDAGSLQGSIVNDANLVFDQTGTGSFGGTVSGSGSLTKSNTGVLILTGVNAYTGGTTVEAGRLTINGSVANSVVTVGGGGEIGGNGTLGGLIVRNNAAASPGNSIGQLQVATFVVFEPLSRYSVEVNAAGQSDRIAATGTATLQGGTVEVLAEDGAYQPTSDYAILTAAGGVTGKFNGATSNLAFLSPVLTYGPTSVTLTMVRNDLTFSNAGITANQVQTGTALDTAFRFGSPVYTALIGASAPDVRSAFDQFSGELHAHVSTSAAADARLLRDAMSARLVGARTEGRAVWGHALGGWAKTDGDGNAAKLDQDTTGVLFGVESALGAAGLIGVSAGYTATDLDIDARASSAKVKAMSVGLYGRADHGAARLWGGLGYSALDVETERDVSFGGFSDRLSGDYDGSALQAFAEAGYAAEFGGLSVEPFAGLTALRLRTDAATEAGGASALRIDGEDRDLVLTTLGVRSRAELGGAGGPMTVQAMLGWRGASGDREAITRNQFAGGPAFLVEGATIEKSALVLDLGLDWSVNDALAVRASYAGEIADKAEGHALSASVSFVF